MASTSPASTAFWSSSFAASTAAFSSAVTLSPSSPSCFSISKIMPSDWFFVSTASFCFLSSSAYCSASLIFALISSSESLVEDVMVIFCSLPVAISLALTLTMPLASISKVTSICGMPRGAGAMPESWNLPSVMLPAAISLSPCITWMSTAVWLSAAVEKIWLFFVGIVVFLSISFVATPPSVSMDSDSGVTSRSRMSLTSPVSTPAWMAAPMATHSSGLMPLNGSLPVTFFTAS